MIESGYPQMEILIKNVHGLEPVTNLNKIAITYKNFYNR
jgi:hypothetical protein